MIKQHQYEQFIKAVTDEIQEDWVLVGGALIALLTPNSRATADIDLCPIGEMTNERRINLMKIAQASGLGIEAINPSADFFLRQIPNWKSSLVLFIKGKKGSLYRPSLELYIRMKCERLSESDLSDCLAFLDWHARNNIAYDPQALRQILLQKKTASLTPKQLSNLEVLLSKF